ncbi:18592_t:CDS:2, partial [Acaulospora morrowiae]
FCTSHYVSVIIFSILIIISLCYPAIDTYYLRSSKNENQAFFWEDYSSSSAVTRDTFMEKCRTQPSFHVEQVIIQTIRSMNLKKGSNDVLSRDLLLWTLGLQERIANAVIMYTNELSQLPLQTAKKYTLSNLCLKPFNNEECLILSPLEYWSYSAEKLSKDQSISRSLSLSNKTNSFGIPMPLRSVFGNLSYDKRKGDVVGADSIVLTYFLKDMGDCTEGQTAVIWDMLWNQVINCTGADCYIGGKGINMTNRGNLKHFHLEFDRNNTTKFPVEFILLVIEYLVAFLYISLSLGRLNSVKSKFGLAFSIVIQLFVSLVTSISICSLFGFTLTLVSWELFPFVLIIVGVENMFVLTSAVASIPMQLEVKERVSRGLEKVSYSITKTLVTGLLLLFMCSTTGIDSVQEFCIFTSVAMIIDYVLQMSFFVTILSIDLRRLEYE